MATNSTRARAGRAAAAASALALVVTGAPAIAGAAVPGPAGAHARGVIDITGTTTSVLADGRQKFSYDKASTGWSITATKPTTGRVKTDLTLFGERRGGEALARSGLKGDKIDFVVVDSNHAQTPKTWFPTVRSQGAGTYTIQNQSEPDMLKCPGFTYVTMAEGQLVHAMDVYLDADFFYSIGVNGDDEHLYLMKSAASFPDTYYQGLGDAINEASPDVAILEQGTDDWYTLVLTQPSGSGRYTLECYTEPAEPAS